MILSALKENKSKKWGYRLDTNEDIDFKFTSAYETGHEILKKYGGDFLLLWT